MLRTTKLTEGTSSYAWHIAWDEPPLLLVLVIFAALAPLWQMRESASASHMPGPRPRAWPVERPAQVVALSVIVALVATIGARVLFHGALLSADEFAMSFQARVLASGRVAATVPAEWIPFARAMTPTFIVYRPEAHTWLSGYLPVYAALRALFLAASVEWLTNPVLGAVTVPLTWAVARRLWPGGAFEIRLALLFLITSSQFLVTSMSGYSMSAHLVANLLWLYLYLRGDRPSLATAPFVGALALGLHNPFPHALFVAPFLWRAFARRRGWWLAYAGTIYAAASVGWFRYLAHSSPDYGGDRSLSVFGFPTPSAFVIQLLNLGVTLSWQTPLLSLLVGVAFLSWRRLGSVERDLASGLLLTFAFYIFFTLSQGQGWGYRYIYGALGNLVLLAVSGAVIVRDSVGSARLGRLLTVSVAATALVQLPLRAFQVERYVRPYARAFAHTRAIDATVAVIDPTTSWHGYLLVRNDPFLENSPMVLSAERLTAEDWARLRKRFGDRVHVVRPPELARLGLPTWPSALPPP